MGCLLSCCGGEEGEGGPDGERTRLLSECGSQIQVNLSNKVSPVLATAPAKILLVVKEAFIFNKIS